ncbi:kinesin-like protein KIN-4A isoform X2 [Daucus carota subsp. sativus]|uniref:kinesin-like protein KIN-4A isoform X2 n=1 Tax=Daucus carota subsp. sativus TaxID=79200 RepID=UPI0007F00FC2|nr:PREDICTED: kinesin-like protein KIN-4A isoform X2 [Daucus carota subsp. sativus]
MEEASSENCNVKVAVHIRPLIGDEKLQRCRECVAVTPGKPQLHIGTRSFTFDYIYGEKGSPPASMFKDCIAPLVDGLFQGYNGTVLAYGQTGSGKTYTMGTGLREQGQTGLIPQVMTALFDKIDKLKHQAEYQLHVSFIEILKEEVKDLLDSTSLGKYDTSHAISRHVTKVTVPGKAPIQIREASNGVITLAGSTEISVSTLNDMAACLEQGLLNRATGSTNMNTESSRSHAIFTITLEQMCKLPPVNCDEINLRGDMDGDYLCAKLHLVDLAGSERAKRTGSDGLRMLEGIHINKGLLALGNVISALGDEKKRKDGVHVPYRDSKLTRLLQDSLGGNSKTVMIACISPADINAEETSNTLKYANRARNIQNKPIVNREMFSGEMHTLRKQIEYLQEELTISRKRDSSDEVQALKEHISWLETTNRDLSQKLHEYHSREGDPEQFEQESPEGCSYIVKKEGLKRGLQSMNSSYPMDESREGTNHRRTEDFAVKEWEHTLIQNTMGTELNELNKRLEQKESEMKIFGWYDTEALKKHYGKKIRELEEEKRIMQEERDSLLAEIERLAACDVPSAVQNNQKQKVEALEISDLQKKQDSQLLLLKQKQRNEEATKRRQTEIHSIKVQKVQLQHKIKQEAERFRQLKAFHEKELSQLRKEGRRNEFERHKLQALNQRQKLVVQRKTEEAAVATKKLKQLLESRKAAARDNLVYPYGHTTTRQGNDRALQVWLDHELEVMVNMHVVRFEYGKQQKLRASLAEELSLLKQTDQPSFRGISSGGEECSSLPLMSPHTRLDRISSLEKMLTTSSDALSSMASQLSEAERRGRGSNSCRRWSLLRSMGDAKKLLQHMFSVATDSRSRLWEMELEMKEMKIKLTELVTELQQIEAQRKETLKEQKLKDQAVAIALAISSLASGKCKENDTPSPRFLPAEKLSMFKAGTANMAIRDLAALTDSKKMRPLKSLSLERMRYIRQGGKLWRWKRSHQQWLLQFKWRWQKPWKLLQWLKESEEILLSSGHSVVVR